MTLAYQAVGTMYGKNELNNPAITSTSLDTTATVTGKPIDNRDGRINFVSMDIYCTDKTGSSPTLTLTLQGSNDGTNYFDLVDTAGNTIASSATSISAAGSGTTVAININTVAKPRTTFPAFLRPKIAVGGTGSPGWTGTTSNLITRNAY